MTTTTTTPTRQEMEELRDAYGLITAMDEVIKYADWLNIDYTAIQAAFAEPLARAMNIIHEE